MAWRAEVKISGHWEHNSVTFDTKKEAADSARSLFERWTLAEDYRAVEVVDEPAKVPEGEK